ncbi:MAG TPA: Hpt domain-containing protein, partial [Phnomibacter sp.]|nr:Hpt domain-containing protein [Phnomibacter sp.]
MSTKDFLQEYVEEVRENLRELEDSLLGLERKGRDEEEIRRLFRAAHSIKGASSYMGFERTAHLTHEMESVVSRILKESLPILPQGITTLLGCVDFVSRT